MKFASTNSPQAICSAREAILSGLAPDGGLYMPTALPELRRSVLDSLHSLSFVDIAFEVSKQFLSEEMSPAELTGIVERAFPFDAPLVNIHDNTYSLELFHGPTLAFKDFGARFMSQLMSYFRRNEDRVLTILVATSGDTGGAVASGFHNVEGTRVVVLYPSGQVSPIQEAQLTTLGGNVTALEIDGTFDDCQRLVKASFVDPDLRKRLELSSANSINIARLIPQSFYYFRAVGQVAPETPSVWFSVPSGNFGNLTAGLFAKRLGLRSARFIAATNVNDVVPQYLLSGNYSPTASKRTISNAMDVGNPSNFARLLALYGNSVERMREDIHGSAFTDAETRATMKKVYEKYGYILDPHGAVAYLGLENAVDLVRSVPGVLLETAHPAKFVETVTDVLEQEIPIPAALRDALQKPKKAVQLSAELAPLKEFLRQLPA